MNKLARENLMSISDVETFYRYYCPTEGGGNGLEISKVAGESVFNAWFKNALNHEDIPDYMCLLSDLRDLYDDLDRDLHKLCADKETFIRAKWAEKDAQKYGNNSGGQDEEVFHGKADSYAGGDCGAGESGAAVSGSGTQSDNVPTGEWDAGDASTNPGATTDDWNKENANPSIVVNDFSEDGVEKVDWSDEMNQLPVKPLPVRW